MTFPVKKISNVAPLVRLCLFTVTRRVLRRRDAHPECERDHSRATLEIMGQRQESETGGLVAGGIVANGTFTGRGLKPGQCLHHIDGEPGTGGPVFQAEVM